VIRKLKTFVLTYFHPASEKRENSDFATTQKAAFSKYLDLLAD
jgi:hypothetical protein